MTKFDQKLPSNNRKYEANSLPILKPTTRSIPLYFVPFKSTKKQHSIKTNTLTPPGYPTRFTSVPKRIIPLTLQKRLIKDLDLNQNRILAPVPNFIYSENGNRSGNSQIFNSKRLSHSNNLIECIRYSTNNSTYINGKATLNLETNPLTISTEIGIKKLPKISTDTIVINKSATAFLFEDIVGVFKFYCKNQLSAEHLNWIGKRYKIKQVSDSTWLEYDSIIQENTDIDNDLFPLSNDTRTNHRFSLVPQNKQPTLEPRLKSHGLKSASINNLKSENSMTTLHRSNTSVKPPKAKFSSTGQSLIQPNRNLRSLNSTLFSAKSKESVHPILKTKRHELEQPAPKSFLKQPSNRDYDAKRSSTVSHTTNNSSLSTDKQEKQTARNDLKVQNSNRKPFNNIVVIEDDVVLSDGSSETIAEASPHFNPKQQDLSSCVNIVSEKSDTPSVKSVDIKADASFPIIPTRTKTKTLYHVTPTAEKLEPVSSVSTTSLSPALTEIEQKLLSSTPDKRQEKSSSPVSITIKEHSLSPVSARPDKRLLSSSPIIEKSTSPVLVTTDEKHLFPDVITMESRSPSPFTTMKEFESSSPPSSLITETKSPSPALVMSNTDSRSPDTSILTEPQYSASESSLITEVNFPSEFTPIVREDASPCSDIVPIVETRTPSPTDSIITGTEPPPLAVSTISESKSQSSFITTTTKAASPNEQTITDTDVQLKDISDSKEHKQFSYKSETKEATVCQNNASRLGQNSDSESLARTSNTTKPNSSLASFSQNRDSSKACNTFDKSFLFTFKDGKSLNIEKKDFDRLSGDEFLNDNLILFYLKLIQQNHPELKTNLHVFNSFFYEKIKRFTDKKRDYEAVRSWTTKANLFSKDLIIIPINHKMHWFVAIVYNLPALLNFEPIDVDSELLSTDIEKSESQGLHRMSLRSKTRQENQTKRPFDKKTDCKIFFCDSLQRGNYNYHTRNLCNFFVEEAKDKYKLNIDVTRISSSLVSVPPQNNLSDCGVYLIHYVEMFLNDPYYFVKLFLSDSANDERTLEKFWNTRLLKDKRKYLRQLMIWYRNQQIKEKSVGSSKSELNSSNNYSSDRNDYKSSGKGQKTSHTEVDDKEHSSATQFYSNQNLPLKHDPDGDTIMDDSSSISNTETNELSQDSNDEDDDGIQLISIFERPITKGSCRSKPLKKVSSASLKNLR